VSVVEVSKPPKEVFGIILELESELGDEYNAFYFAKCYSELCYQNGVRRREFTLLFKSSYGAVLYMDDFKKLEKVLAKHGAKMASFSVEAAPPPESGRLVLRVSIAFA
jgi:hypothetical protein